MAEDEEEEERAGAVSLNMRVALALILGLGAACTTQPSSRVTIDVLDYVIGASDTWPRHGPNHHQHQYLEANRVTWTKYTLGWMFETWRWDDRWIYHVVDHGIDNRRWEHYVFSDGRWLPRRLVKGETWTLDLPGNTLTWYDADCVAQPERPAPYRVRAWHAGSVDAGGDLGARDVIVLAYQPDPQHAEPDTEEHFYFAKGAGWYRWTRGTAEVTFNRIGGIARTPTSWCARDFEGG